MLGRAPITDVRDVLAALLQDGLSLDHGSGRMPSPLYASTVFVVPQSGVNYIDREDGTYCKPTYALSAFLVGSTTNIGDAYDWLDWKLDQLEPVIDSDPTLGGRVSEIAVSAVSQPGFLNAQGGAFLSVEVQFTRFFLSTNFHP